MTADLGDVLVELPYADAEYARVPLRDYLADVLAALWREGDAFSAKRPLGVSDWQWPVYRALAAAGHLATTGDLDDLPCDDQSAAIHEADQLVERYVRDLLAGGVTT